MDAISDDLIERVVVMKSGRVGFTSIAENAIGYYIDHDPCPIVMYQPTVEDAEGWSKDHLVPLLRDTPALSNKVALSRSRNSDNTILHKKFPGGFIKIAGANSPRSFRRITARIIIFDELDGAPPSAGSEGAPLHLAERRTATVWNRKIITGSTPTVAGVSQIENEFAHSSQGHFFVPCPRCRHLQKLVFSQKSMFAKPTNGAIIGEVSRGYLKFDSEGASWACYVCENCQAELAEADKYQMIPRGVWRHLRPEATTVAGFHISELYSTFNTTWTRLAADFLKAKRQRETLRVFINTRLGETFEEQDAYTVSDHVLSDRVESYSEIPAVASLLTAGVDVQNDRVEVSVWAWAPEDESFLIDHVVLIGSPTDPVVWENLDTYLLRKFRHASGVDLKVTCTFVDSGASSTDVYRFTAPRRKRAIYAVKGYGNPRPLIGKVSLVKRYGAYLIPLGVDEAKLKIYKRLQNEPKDLEGRRGGPGVLHFNEKATPDYLRQLTAERLVVSWKKGFPVRQWTLPHGRRNEALDCAVYALCAREFLPINTVDRHAARIQEEAERLRMTGGAVGDPEESEKKPESEQKKKTKVRRPRRPGSSFVNSWRR